MKNRTADKTDNEAKVMPVVQLLRICDLPDSESDAFCKVKFGKMLRAAKGTRSTREFALQSGVSESFISKALTGCLEAPPSKRTLLKLLRAEIDASVDLKELVKSAGYPDLEFQEPEQGEIQEAAHLSVAQFIARQYGSDSFAACAELMRTLTRHGCDGDMTSHFYRKEGYFEIRDERTGQIYAGINAYCAKTVMEPESVNSLTFSAAITYSHIQTTRDAQEKIIIILTDNERIYDGCRTALNGISTITTIVAFTQDHLKFQKEEVFKASGAEAISLIDI